MTQLTKYSSYVRKSNLWQKSLIFFLCIAVFWIKMPGDGPKIEVYSSQKAGKRIEILTELTTSGKWLIYCLIHLLFQGKNSDTKQKIHPTFLWLENNPNINVPETTVRRVLKKEFIDNLKPLAYVRIFYKPIWCPGKSGPTYFTWEIFFLLLCSSFTPWMGWGS